MSSLFKRTRPAEPEQPAMSVNDIAQLSPEQNAALSSASASNSMMHVVQLWSDRLQLITVFASFFTSVDGLLLGLTTPIRTQSVVGKVANAALSGALIFHSAAAILAFVGSFILIHYKFITAKQKDPLLLGFTHAPSRLKPNHHTVNHARDVSGVETATMFSRTSSEKQNPDTIRSVPYPGATLQAPTPPRLGTHLEREFTMLSDSVTDGIVVLRRYPLRFRWFKAKDAGTGTGEEDMIVHAELLTKLLTRCHNACAAFASLGFVLNIAGFVLFAWAALGRGVSIFVSACVVCTVTVGLMAVY